MVDFITDKELVAIEYAKELYAKYGEFTDNKNFMGNEMPKWDDLPDKIKGAWTHVAKYVIDEMD